MPKKQKKKRNTKPHKIFEPPWSKETLMKVPGKTEIDEDGVARGVGTGRTLANYVYLLRFLKSAVLLQRKC